MAIASIKDRPWHKQLMIYVEYGFIRLVFAGVRVLSFAQASAVGAAVGHVLGPCLISLNKRARHNLTAAFPEKTPPEITAIIRGMWRNMGRTVFEFMVLDKFMASDKTDRIQVDYPQLTEAQQAEGILFFAGHLANWELIPLIAMDVGLRPLIIYRQANNPLIDRMIQRHRHSLGLTDMEPKGAEGARAVIRALRQNRNVALLVDQKMNDGLPVPFFGRDAMTAPALAQLALKFDRWVMPTCVVRVRGATFRVMYEPAFKFESTGDIKADTMAALVEVNATLERWIRAHPEQWLWMHNRWPKD